ncbi:outer membrane protein assembly factor BamD [uncultured Parasphingopyxis sp.]|uniref:outer membrane protein assembly factor BamD n=1 Tax=uncultured Parasphingopyxis sp. TaxID=1547918 RepID=UPI002627ADCF|nr:outer membrane protein assembly factor BamD [uncultured Parasphingopyxis sp.]
MAIPYRSAALVVAAALFAPLASCAGPSAQTRADTQFIARDVNTLYNLAKDQLDRNRFETAAALFAEVERQHPYSPWARRAQIMGAFSHYLARNYTESVQTAQRFLSIHPGNRDAPYAYYLIAISYYEQISDVTRDQSVTIQAKSALEELIRRYPQSEYAADARLKLDLVNDHLAGKDMEVGRFYQRRRQWLAATIRFRSVVEQFETTTHAPEALMRLTECYLALGLVDEARRSAAVLGNNYPETQWYEQAYELMQEHGGA